MKYETKRKVTLTLAQWQELICALHDARRYNERKDFHGIAASINELRLAIHDQVGEPLDKARRALSASLVNSALQCGKATEGCATSTSNLTKKG